MARTATGTIIKTTTGVGTPAEAVTYSARFRAYGKRRCIRLGSTADGFTRERADQELSYLLAQVARGDWTPPAPAPTITEPEPVPNFQEFASDWFELRVKLGGRGKRAGKGLTASGEADLLWRLEKHLIPTFGDLALNEITTQSVDNWRVKKTGPDFNNTSINKCLSTLKAIMEQAYDYGKIGRVPKINFAPAFTPDRTLITCTAHIKALLDAADEVDTAHARPGQRRAMIAVFVLAGLRHGEALELRRDDIDLAAGVIRVRAEVDGAAKGDAARRRVLMLPVLRDELDRWLAVTSLAPDDLAFATKTGAKQSESNVIGRVIGRSVDAANAKLVKAGERPMDHLTPKSLRATFASMLYVLGEPKPSILAQMGHTQEDVTLKHYAQAWEPGDAEHLRAFVRGDSQPGPRLVNDQVWASSADSVPGRSVRDAA